MVERKWVYGFHETLLLVNFEKDRKTKNKFKGENLPPEISHPAISKTSTDGSSPSQPCISYADAVRKKTDGNVRAVNRTAVGLLEPTAVHNTALKW